MTSDEVGALNDGLMLKSSLEHYATLDGQMILGSDPLVNLAHSFNTITQELATTLTEKHNINKLLLKVIPNPIKDYLNLSSINKTVRNKIV